MDKMIDSNNMMQYTTLSMQVDKLDNSIIHSFKNLPVDEFLNANEPYKYRYRRYGSAKVIDSLILWKHIPESFLQNAKINKYAGDISRSFPTLEADLQRFVGDHIISLVIDKSIPSGNYEIGVHQIRITANDQYMGKPAPEGIHQDGFDYVAVSCIDMDNIVGGTSVLVDPKDHRKTFLEKELSCGEILVFNDRSYAHYASPIVPKIPGNCYRDVIVTTYKKIS